MPRLALLLPLCLAACAGEQAGYPRLLPLEAVLVEEPLAPSPAPGLESRAAALRARAEALRHSPL